MKNYRSPKLLILCGSLLMFSSFQAYAVDPSPNTTRLLASQCAQCHGTSGNSLGGFDSIAGESFQELYNELLEMKAENDNEIMHKQIKAYTDDQVFFIADYYSRLPSNPNGDGGDDSGGFGDSDDFDRSDDSNDSNDSNSSNDLNDSNRTLSKAELKAKKKREKAEAKAAKKRAKAAAKAAKRREKEAKKRAKAAAKAAKRREKEARRNSENDSNRSNDANDSNDSNRILSKAELKAKKKREKAEAKAAKKRAKAAAKAAKRREREGR